MNEKNENLVVAKDELIQLSKAKNPKNSSISIEQTIKEFFRRS